MIYPFMTLEDGTEVVHSEMKEDGSVKVYIEKPVTLGFHSVECWLPRYEWKNNRGFSADELAFFDEFVHSLAHIIIELSQKGGFDKGENPSELRLSCGRA